MIPYYQDDAVTLYHGDCLDVLAELPDESVHAVVTDPPYGLANTGPAHVVETLTRWANGDRDYLPGGAGFMGKAWDAFVPPVAVWDECLRVLKPGGHLLAFAGSRTFDLMTLGVRMAGFEIRDGIAWLYAQGFPKSLNLVGDDGTRTGWGTALKPAFEPIVVARKPLTGTVAANVLAHGTGALNIDGCRVCAPPDGDPSRFVGIKGSDIYAQDAWTKANMGGRVMDQSKGRWPTNVILDDTTAQDLDEQTGILTSGANPTRRSTDKFRDAYGDFKGQEECTPARGADSGGASRMFPVFRYEPKAPTSERPRIDGIAHPTVKPLALMRWLVRLVTPPGGVVLDPFAGSGTTLEAAVTEGFKAIGVEMTSDYLPLIVSRLDKPIQTGFNFDGEAS